MLAVAGGHVDAVSLLLEREANVNVANNHGLTALHLGVSIKHYEKPFRSHCLSVFLTSSFCLAFSETRVPPEQLYLSVFHYNKLMSYMCTSLFIWTVNQIADIMNL